MSDPATLAFYEAAAGRYATLGASTDERFLSPFLDRLEPGVRILELGCGAGRQAARMIALGFEVDATDAAAAMVAQARTTFGIPARQMRFDELDAPARYDAVWANACLIHAARREVPGILARIAAALRPGGWHFASFKLGEAEGRDPLGRLHNFPSEEWLRAAYRDAGFRIADAERFRGAGADGVVRDWLAITVQTCA